MLALDIPAGALAGIVSFYAIVHLPREALRRRIRGDAQGLASPGA